MCFCGNSVISTNYEDVAKPQKVGFATSAYLSATKTSPT